MVGKVLICPRPGCGGGTFTNEDGLDQCWLCGRVQDGPEPLIAVPEARGLRWKMRANGIRKKVGVINGQETRRR